MSEVIMSETAPPPPPPPRHEPGPMPEAAPPPAPANAPPPPAHMQVQQVQQQQQQQQGIPNPPVMQQAPKEIVHTTKSEQSGRKGRFRLVGGLYVCGKRYVGKMSRHAWCGRGFATEQLVQAHHEGGHESPATPDDGSPEKNPICMWEGPQGKCTYIAKVQPTDKGMDDHLQEHLKAQDDAVSGTMLRCQWSGMNGAMCGDNFTRKDTKKFSQHVKAHVQQASTQADAEKKATGGTSMSCGWTACHYMLTGVLKEDVKHATSVHGCTSVGNKERPCLWAGCGNIAAKLERSQSHIWEHSGYVRFQCTKGTMGTAGPCEKKFTSPQAMKLHMRSCGALPGMGPNKEKRYQCPEVGCNYKTAQPGHLNRHKKIHNKGDKPKVGEMQMQQQVNQVPPGPPPAPAGP